MVALDSEAAQSDGDAALYDANKLTAPIKTIQDKYELLPAFLKVRHHFAGLPWSPCLVTAPHCPNAPPRCKQTAPMQSRACFVCWWLHVASASACLLG